MLDVAWRSVLAAIVTATLALAGPASAQQPPAQQRPAQPAAPRAAQPAPPRAAQPAAPPRAAQPAVPQLPASHLAAAKELLAMKGSLNILEPLVVGVVEQTKNVFMQTNFNLAKDLNEVGLELRKEFAPRRDALMDDVTRNFASRFTEQELRDSITFFQSPLGKKLLTEEPLFVEATLQYAQGWANRLSEEVMGKFRAGMKKRGHDL